LTLSNFGRQAGAEPVQMVLQQVAMLIRVQQGDLQIAIFDL
jgi:hypothetical protein